MPSEVSLSMPKIADTEESSVLAAGELLIYLHASYESTRFARMECLEQFVGYLTGEHPCFHRVRWAKEDRLFSDHRHVCCDKVTQTELRDVCQHPIQCRRRTDSVRNGSVWCAIISKRWSRGARLRGASALRTFFN